MSLSKTTLLVPAGAIKDTAFLPYALVKDVESMERPVDLVREGCSNNCDPIAISQSPARTAANNLDTSDREKSDPGAKVRRTSAPMRLAPKKSEVIESDIPSSFGCRIILHFILLAISSVRSVEPSSHMTTSPK